LNKGHARPRPRRCDRNLADAVARALGGGSSDEERYTEGGGAYHCEVWRCVWFVFRLVTVRFIVG
jgi:hypothetical protein